MQHPLDNMVWNALRGPQAPLGTGTDLAVRFDRDVSVFAAVAEPLQSLEGLAEIIDDGAPAGLVTTDPLALPSDLELISTGEVVQLTAPQFRPLSGPTPVWRDLTTDDVPAMQELVALT